MDDKTRKTIIRGINSATVANIDNILSFHNDKIKVDEQIKCSLFDETKVGGHTFAISININILKID